MNLIGRITRTQLLLFLFIIVTLLVTAFVIFHAALPGVWHVVAVSPDVLNWWH